jgi:hypothetical protein
MGATCLHIASKCEDVSFLAFNHLADRSTDVTLDQSSMLEAEESILNCLDFDLYIPTVIDFLHIFLLHVRGHDTDDLIEPFGPFARYLAEASLMFTVFVGVKKSSLAAAIMYYSMDIFSADDDGWSWSSQLEELTKLNRPCLQDTYDEVKKMHGYLYSRASGVVYDRYLDSERCQVALIRPS